VTLPPATIDTDLAADEAVLRRLRVIKAIKAILEVNRPGITQNQQYVEFEVYDSSSCDGMGWV
jgi:hypothetical protein